MNLLDLLKRPEGKSLEYKRDLSSPDGVLRSIVAFANTAGGTLLIARRMVERGVRFVQVYPSPARPHYLKSAGLENGVFVRVGSTNRRVEREMIEELRRFARGEGFDEQPLPELNSEALDFRAASELFAPVRKLKRPDLETLKLITMHQGRKVPTVGGVLLFGKERERYFSEAWIQAGRFQGEDRSHIADTLEIRAHLPIAVEEAIAFVRKHNTRAAEIGSVRRTERWDLPPVAVREAVINAVVHADYSQRGAPIRISIFDNRLEIENPGLLPFGLIVEDLRYGISKLRNRVMGRVFHDLGLIELWGSGIQRMNGACREAGLDDPILEEIGTHFRVTLYTARKHRPSVDEVEQAILATLASGKGLSTQKIAAKIKRSSRATRTRLLSLVARGLVAEVGTSPQDPRRQYFLAHKR